MEIKKNSSEPSLEQSMEEAAEVVDPYLPLNQSFFENPYPYYHRLRAEHSVHWSEAIQAWVVTSFKDVHEGVRNPSLVASRGDTYFGMLPPEAREALQPLQDFFNQWLLFSDPPYHDKVKKLIGKAFTPKTVDSIKGHIEGTADRLLNAAKDKGEMEAISDFTMPLSVSVIAKTLGVSVEAYSQVLEWTNNIVGFMGTGRPEIERGRAALVSLSELRAYLDAVFDEKRRNPQEDLLTALIQATDNGEMLNSDELLATCGNLLIDGHEPSSLAMANGTFALLQNPEQLAMLRTNPSLAVSATEEILRYEPPFTYLGRRSRERMLLGDKVIEEDQRVLLIIGGANRDPQHFAQPDSFDITRKPNSHFTFGLGTHFCIGSALARATVSIGISKLAERFDTLSLAERASVVWRQSLGFRAVTELPITCK